MEEARGDADLIYGGAGYMLVDFDRDHRVHDMKMGAERGPTLFIDKGYVLSYTPIGLYGAGSAIPYKGMFCLCSMLY